MALGIAEGFDSDYPGLASTSSDEESTDQPAGSPPTNGGTTRVVGKANMNSSPTTTKAGSSSDTKTKGTGSPITQRGNSSGDNKSKASAAMTGSKGRVQNPKAATPLSKAPPAIKDINETDKSKDTYVPPHMRWMYRDQAKTPAAADEQKTSKDDEKKTTVVGEQKTAVVDEKESSKDTNVPSLIKGPSANKDINETDKSKDTYVPPHMRWMYQGKAKTPAAVEEQKTSQIGEKKTPVVDEKKTPMTGKLKAPVSDVKKGHVAGKHVKSNIGEKKSHKTTADRKNFDRSELKTSMTCKPEKSEPEKDYEFVPFTEEEKAWIVNSMFEPAVDMPMPERFKKELEYWERQDKLAAEQTVDPSHGHHGQLEGSQNPVADVKRGAKESSGKTSSVRPHRRAAQPMAAKAPLKTSTQDVTKNPITKSTQDSAKKTVMNSTLNFTKEPVTESAQDVTKEHTTKSTVDLTKEPATEDTHRSCKDVTEKPAHVPPHLRWAKKLESKKTVVKDQKEGQEDPIPVTDTKSPASKANQDGPKKANEKSVKAAPQEDEDRSEHTPPHLRWAKKLESKEAVVKDQMGGPKKPSPVADNTLYSPRVDQNGPKKADDTSVEAASSKDEVKSKHTSSHKPLAQQNESQKNDTKDAKDDAKKAVVKNIEEAAQKTTDNTPHIPPHERYAKQHEQKMAAEKTANDDAEKAVKKGASDDATKAVVKDGAGTAQKATGDTPHVPPHERFAKQYELRKAAEKGQKDDAKKASVNDGQETTHTGNTPHVPPHERFAKQYELSMAAEKGQKGDAKKAAGMPAKNRTKRTYVMTQNDAKTTVVSKQPNAPKNATRNGEEKAAKQMAQEAQNEPIWKHSKVSLEDDARAIQKAQYGAFVDPETGEPEPMSWEDALKAAAQNIERMPPPVRDDDLDEESKRMLREMAEDAESPMEEWRQLFQSFLPVWLQHVKKPVYYRERMEQERKNRLDAQYTRENQRRRVQGLDTDPLLGMPLKFRYPSSKPPREEQIRKEYAKKYDNDTLPIIKLPPGQVLSQQLLPGEETSLQMEGVIDVRDPSWDGNSPMVGLPAEFADPESFHPHQPEPNLISCNNELFPPPLEWEERPQFDWLTPYYRARVVKWLDDLIRDMVEDGYKVDITSTRFTDGDVLDGAVREAYQDRPGVTLEYGPVYWNFTITEPPKDRISRDLLPKAMTAQEAMKRIEELVKIPRLNEIEAYEANQMKLLALQEKARDDWSRDEAIRQHAYDEHMRKRDVDRPQASAKKEESPPIPSTNGTQETKKHTLITKTQGNGKVAAAPKQVATAPKQVATAPKQVATAPKQVADAAKQTANATTHESPKPRRIVRRYLFNGEGAVAMSKADLTRLSKATQDMEKEQNRMADKSPGGMQKQRYQTILEANERHSKEAEECRALFAQRAAERAESTKKGNEEHGSAVAAKQAAREAAAGRNGANGMTNATSQAEGARVAPKAITTTDVIDKTDAAEKATQPAKITASPNDANNANDANDATAQAKDARDAPKATTTTDVIGKTDAAAKSTQPTVTADTKDANDANDATTQAKDARDAPTATTTTGVIDRKDAAVKITQPANITAIANDATDATTQAEDARDAPKATTDVIEKADAEKHTQPADVTADAAEKKVQSLEVITDAVEKKVQLTHVIAESPEKKVQAANIAGDAKVEDTKESIPDESVKGDSLDKDDKSKRSTEVTERAAATEAHPHKVEKVDSSEKETPSTKAANAVKPKDTTKATAESDEAETSEKEVEPMETTDIAKRATTTDDTTTTACTKCKKYEALGELMTRAFAQIKNESKHTESAEKLCSLESVIEMVAKGIADITKTPESTGLDQTANNPSTTTTVHATDKTLQAIDTLPTPHTESTHEDRPAKEAGSTNLTTTEEMKETTPPIDEDTKKSTTADEASRAKKLEMINDSGDKEMKEKRKDSTPTGAADTHSDEEVNEVIHPTNIDMKEDERAEGATKAKDAIRSMDTELSEKIALQNIKETEVDPDAEDFKKTEVDPDAEDFKKTTDRVEFEETNTAEAAKTGSAGEKMKIDSAGGELKTEVAGEDIDADPPTAVAETSSAINKAKKSKGVKTETKLVSKFMSGMFRAGNPIFPPEMKPHLRGGPCKAVAFGNPFTPLLNMYIRPATKQDMQQISDLYAHYVKNTVSAIETFAPRADQWLERHDLAERKQRPFMVAVLKKTKHDAFKEVLRDFERPKPKKTPRKDWMPPSDAERNRNRLPPNVERVVGFAYSEPFSFNDTIFDGALELMIYTHKDYLHQGVMKNLMDRVLESHDLTYKSFRGTDLDIYDDIGHHWWLNGLAYARQTVVSLFFERGKEEMFNWQKKVLEEVFDFHQASLLVNIAVKDKKP